MSGSKFKSLMTARHSQSPQKNGVGEIRDLTFPMLGLLLVSIGLTIFAWELTTRFTNDKNALAFSTLINDNELALLHRVETYRQGLDGGAGLLRASDFVSAEEWRAYVQALRLEQSLPGISGIGLILPVEAGETDQFVADAVTDGFEDFAIHPNDAPDNYIIRLIEPLAPNRAALGLNIAFEENRRSAAELARDSGRPAITKRIFLVQDQVKGAGFLLLRPLYKSLTVPDTVEQRRAEFWGWVYAPFSAKRFLSNLTSTQGFSLNVSMYDGDVVDEGQLIYSSAEESDRMAQANFTAVKQVELMGQTWTIVWQSTPEFDSSVANNGPMIVLIAGSALSVLFAALWLLYVKREATIQLVESKSREIETSEGRFRLALKNAPNGMALVGLDGKWLSVNQELCSFFGLSEDEIFQTNAQTLTHPDHPEGYRDCTNQLRDGSLQVYREEKQFMRPDGGVNWGLMSISESRDTQNNAEYFILQILDITDRKEIEKVKGEFIAVVSHELRTPLTSIRGSLGLVSNTMSESIPDSAMRLLNIAHKNCERLIILINDILDLEKLSSGDLQIQLAEESVVDLVEQAIEVNQAYADQYGVTFKFAGDRDKMYFEVDQTRMHQVLSNFMSNAAKFSPENGDVLVNVERMSERLRISVIDSGPGIPVDFRARIFTPFSQADASTTRTKGGTGLGLHITKELVEGMGGTIGFESEVGKGSVFWVEFPLLKDEIRLERAMLTDTNLPVALHAEDNKDFSEVLSAAMEGKVNIVNRTTCAETLEMLKAHDFDILIIDEGMPDGNGLDLLDACTGDTKVVIISAHEQKIDDPRITGSFVKARASEAEIAKLLNEMSIDIIAAKAA